MLFRTGPNETFSMRELVIVMLAGASFGAGVGAFSALNLRGEFCSAAELERQTAMLHQLDNDIGVLLAAPRQVIDTLSPATVEKMMHGVIQ